MTSSHVRLMSSIIAVSRPSGFGRPTAANARSPTSASSLPISGSPSAFASRLAGSIVSTIVRLPSRAACIAIAAEVDVLPTPPGPTQTTQRALSSNGSRKSAMLRSLRRLRAGERIDALDDLFQPPALRQLHRLVVEQTDRRQRAPLHEPRHVLRLQRLAIEPQ